MCCSFSLSRADPKETIQLAKIIESTGVRALAIHGRHVEDRPRHIALTDHVAYVADAVSLPTIYNGDVFRHSDIPELKRRSHCNSVMIARGAMWNASIFRPDHLGGFAPLFDVAQQYLAIARKYDNLWQNTKYNLQEMLKEHVGSCPGFQQLTRTKSYAAVDDVMRLIGMDPRATSPYSPPVIHNEARPAGAAADTAPLTSTVEIPSLDCAMMESKSL